MPIYEVQDPRGRTLELEGDHEPTESELTDIFDKAFPEPTRKATIPAPGVTAQDIGPGGASLAISTPQPRMAQQPPPAIQQAGVPSEMDQYEQRAATPEEQATQKKLTTPLLNLPKALYTPPLTSLFAPDIAEAAGGKTKEMIEGMTTPENLATLPYVAAGGAEAAALKEGAYAARVLAGAFGVQGAAQLPDAAKKYVEAVTMRDRKMATEAWMDLVMGSTMALGGVEGVMGLKSALSTPPPIDKPPLIPQAIMEPSRTVDFQPTLLPESRAELNKLPGGEIHGVSSVQNAIKEGKVATDEQSKTGVSGGPSGRGGEPLHIVSQARQISEAIRSGSATDLQQQLAGAPMGAEEFQRLSALVPEEAKPALEAIRQSAIRGRSDSQAVQAALAVLDYQKATGKTGNQISGNEIEGIIRAQERVSPTTPEISPETGRAITTNEPERNLTNASQKPETTTFYGSLRPQPEQSQGQVPVKEGGAGVQPQPEVLPRDQPQPQPQPPAQTSGPVRDVAAPPEPVLEPSTTTPAAEGGAELAATGTPELPAGQVEPAGVPAGRNWDTFYEDLVGDLDSFSPARDTGRRSYEMEDVAQRFVDYAKQDKSGKPLAKLVSDFAKTDDASASQIRKLRASVKNLEAQKAKPPTEAPATAAAKVETQVQEVARTEGQRPAKEVKSELVDRLERAIDVAPSESDVGPKSSTALHGKTTVTPDTAERIEINIPGDGNFKIRNTKEALTEILKRAKKIATDVTPKASIPKGAIKSSELALEKSAAGKALEAEKNVKVNQEKARGSLYDAINKTDEEGIVGRSAPEDDPETYPDGTRWKEWRIRKATPQEVQENYLRNRVEVRWIGERRTVKFSKDKGRTENEWLFDDSGKTRADVIRGMEANMPKDATMQMQAAKAWRDLERMEGGYSFLREGKSESGPGIIGMGGAVPTEFAGTGAGTDIYGIAERVREARAQAMGTEAAPTGKGISMPDSIERGRELLNRGADPEAAMSAFERTKRFSADDLALARAHGEQLAQFAMKVQEKFGTESPEYLRALRTSLEWDARSKKMQTEWHKGGMAQQGATDIDTGSVIGLERAYHDSTGKEFTPDQRRKAVQKSDVVRKAEAEAEAAKAKVAETIAKGVEQAKTTVSDYVLKVAEKWVKQWKAEAAEARKALAGKFLSPTPEDLLNLAKIARADIAEIGLDFAKWTDRMVKEFGPKVQPYLADAWKRGQEMIDAMASKMKDRQTAAQVKRTITKAVDPVKDMWQRAKTLLDAGNTDFDDIVHKLATDTGRSAKDVRQLLAKPKGAKRATDEMYLKMAQRRRVVEQAKNWLKNEQTPGWWRFIRSIPRAFFIDKVFGHGTVGMITHAGLNIFNPRAWSTYWPAFFKQYKLAFSNAAHERMMQDLIRDPNWVTARRAGLINDPFKYADDYQNAAMNNAFGRWFGKLAGGHGFDSLKLFRQARFNQDWARMPEAAKTPDGARMLADAINHATGVVNMPFREWSNWTFFAPKLEGSRWAWMFGDPAKATKIILDWKNATPEQRQFAISQVKEKATIAGTYFTLLAVNDGLLRSMGSSQRINYTDPRKGDFLAFKIAGHRLGVVGPMLGMVRLLANLYHAATAKQTPLESLSGRQQEEASDVASYLRGKLSPFGGKVADVATQADMFRRPVPWSSDRVPAYLRRRGEGKYGWGEYITQEFTPIPISEAIREVWAEQGMDASAIEKALRAITVGVVAGGTGAKVTPDYPQAQTQPQAGRGTRRRLTVPLAP